MAAVGREVDVLAQRISGHRLLTSARAELWSRGASKTPRHLSSFRRLCNIAMRLLLDEQSGAGARAGFIRDGRGALGTHAALTLRCSHHLAVKALAHGHGQGVGVFAGSSVGPAMVHAVRRESMRAPVLAARPTSAPVSVQALM